MKTEIKIQIEVPEGKELRGVKMENGVITPVFKDICPFKEGDIIVDGSGVISMFYRLNDDINPVTGKAPIVYSAIYYAGEFKVKQSVGVGYVKDNRLATEEEKHKFFVEAANAGYECVEGNWIRVPIIKDGDFAVYQEPNGLYRYFIYKELLKPSKSINAYASYLETYTDSVLDTDILCPLCKCRLATERERQILVDKLKEDGFTWDAENKKVEKIKSLSKSWEEWAEKNDNKGIYYIGVDSETYSANLGSNDGFKNSLPTKDLCKAVLALEQLLCLRDEYRQGWEPNWRNNDTKYVIQINSGNIQIVGYYKLSKVLSFQTRELAEAFAENFKDLILKAKELL